MPYIKTVDRARVIDDGQAMNAGELNYAITRVINRYLSQVGLNYQHINDVVGALEGAKMEFYRRVAAPYEDIKIRQNGDVYSPENLT